MSGSTNIVCYETHCRKVCIKRKAEQQQQKRLFFFFFLPCLCRSSGWFPGRAVPSADPVLSPGTRPAGSGGPHTHPPTTEAKAKHDTCQVRVCPVPPLAHPRSECTTVSPTCPARTQTMIPGTLRAAGAWKWGPNLCAEAPRVRKDKREANLGLDSYRRETHQVLESTEPSACWQHLVTPEVN